MLDCVGDGVPVRRPERQRLEDEHIERPLQHVALDGRPSALRHAQEDNLGERRCQRVRRSSSSQPRAASAIIVSVGCLSPVEGNALPPNTKRLATSCAWQYELRTPSFGLTLMRAVPLSWIEPPSGRRRAGCPAPVERPGCPAVDALVPRPSPPRVPLAGGRASGAPGPPGNPAGVTGPGITSPPALRNSSSAFCWKSSINL